ncbi:MAG: hypothetical protein ACI4ST_06415 [Candidatus Gallimonas sp.]
MSDKFNYTYTAPTVEERREIEDIRKEYLPPENVSGTLERLRALDKKAKTPALAAGITLGVVGSLILGLGMSMALEWDMIVRGSVVGVAGLAILAIAYPVWKFLIRRGKKKYGKEILNLSEQLLNEKDAE